MHDPAPVTRMRCCTVCRSLYRADFVRCPADGGVIEEVDNDPLVGATIGHYTIDGFVGEGGMGRVYRAHHSRLESRRIALKVLLGDLAAAMSTRMRFTHEAEAASSLDHPNVVPVIDFGRTDQGLLYLAMELVDGRPLSALIHEGPMAPARVIALARQMAAGLAHAHERGFVHRDFKPDNVLVVAGASGEVPRIVDFGLAISADPSNDSPRFTTVGISVGTPTYAAPEQTHGREIDHRADLFALGVTMFEMLASTVPYDGNMTEVLVANASGPVPRITDRAPTALVTERLEALVRLLMSPEPDDRPQSAREVIAELDDILENPDAPVPIATPPQLVVPVRRRRRWPVLVALLALVAAGSVTWFVRAKRGTEHVATHEPPADAAMVSSVAPSVQAPVVAPAEPPSVVASVEPAPPTPPPRVDVLPVRAPAREPTRRLAALPESPAIETRPDGGVAEPAPPIDAAVAPPTPSAPVVVAREPVVVKPAQPTIVVTTANVSLERLEVRGSLTATTVRRALDRALPALRACYGPAVRAAARSPAVALATELVIDENQVARGVRVGEASLPGLTSCVAGALGSVRSDSAPDVGTVTVRVVVRFTPESS